MALIVIHTDGPWFITCTFAIAASVLHFSIQLRRAAKVAESISSQKNAQPPETFVHPHALAEGSTPPAQTTPDLPSWKDSVEEAPEPSRKPSFSVTVHSIGRTLSLPRSKSLSFLRRPHSKHSVDHAPPPPPPLLLSANSLPLGVPTLTEPFSTNDKDSAEQAEPPISTPDSSATIEPRSAASDNCMHLPKDEAESPSTQMAPAQAMLAAPAAAPAPMSTKSSSSSSLSPQPPRARTTPAPKGPRPRPASMSALGVDARRRYARPACPENSLPGEIFETRFENPFKPRSRSLTVKGEKAGAADTPMAKRHSIFAVFSNLRKSLAKHKRGSDSEAPSESASGSELPSTSPPASSPSSRRTSLSSATGTTLSVGSGSGSTKSKWSSMSSCCMRNGVPRTDPYGPPHFAQMPASSSEGREARRRLRRA